MRSIVRLAAALFILFCSVALAVAAVLMLGDDTAGAQVFATIGLAWAVAAVAGALISRQNLR